jgi:L-alanine-DL-glutamate epimerase-like enolase superfamily enzyme
MDSPAIDSIEVSAYRVPTDAPEADGTIAWDSTTLVLVQARGGDATGTGWTYAPTACGDLIHETLAAVVQERSCWDIAGAQEAMVRAVRNVGRPGVAGCAISAVDTALWDLKARLLDLPLHHLLGAVTEGVPVYGSGGFTTYGKSQLSEQFGNWVDNQGIPRVKMKIGESWGKRMRRDLARMRHAREIIGPRAELFVDANGAYTRKQALRLMERAEDLEVHWFEEPVSSDDLTGLCQVRSRVDADVAAGEYGYDLSYFQRMCAAQAVDCLQADASRCGGITGWQRAATVAAAHGLHITGHSPPHLHVHVAPATPNTRHLEWFHDHVRIESMFFDGTLDPTGGSISPRDDAPGNGLEFRASDAEEYKVH